MKKFNNNSPVLPLLLTSALTLTLGACGGGGGGSDSPTTATPPASAPTGTMNVALTDGPSDDFAHVWVTITAISLHTDPNQTWDSNDATWQTTKLKHPITVDLTQLNNGQINQIFPGLTLPTGSYKQIRLFFAGADDALTTSAQANIPALQWNDQVEYVDNLNVTHDVPLEIAYPTQGIQLNGTFSVTADSQLNLAIDFDLEHDVVPFRHDGQTAFTLKPNLRYFDLNNAGAIVGKVDTSQLCTGASTTNCAYNLIVKAELPTADATRHFDARATTVKADGSFALFPLPTKDASGAPLTYDVLVRGRNMDTLLVQTVPVTLGTTGDLNPTQLQNGVPLALTTNTAEYTAQFDTALQPLTSGWAIFQQTLPSSVMPYEVRWGNTDPFTGELMQPMALAGGPLHVAAYNNGNTLAFNTVQPSETGGAGSYSVATNTPAYHTLSANTC